MPTAISPLAPSSFPEMPPIAGVRLATAAAGIRYAGRTDVLLALFDAGTAVAGVLTRSKCPSAPVDWCRARLKTGAASVLVVNSGNANAFTGKSGRVAAKLTAEIAAKAAHCKTGEVFLASTGVIGESLDATKFAGVIDRLTAEAAPGGWHEAAQAIMTTDTFAKGAAAVVRMGSSAVTICGIAKGAGMIAPDMATMLSFVFTDAPIAPAVLKALLRAGVGDTFNAVTIDSDTSTSDTLLAFATGAAAACGVAKMARLSDPRLPAFRKGFNAVLANLAEQVARDGEGARKLVEIVVEGAVSKKSARRIALSIANSPLVKTAIAGSDPNWGRVLSAAGNAGVLFDPGKTDIWMQGVAVCRGGLAAPFSEAELKQKLDAPECHIRFSLRGKSKGEARFWTCDLTHGYIHINASYRT